MAKGKKFSKKTTSSKTIPEKDRLPIISGVVLVCFFLSGLAGLVYELLWVRLFEKVIGGAPFAVATVLTVFMAGLALGSYLAGRRVDRVPSQGGLLAWYGKLEIGIGAYALLLPLLITMTTPVYIRLYNRLFEYFWFYNLVSFFLCSLLLILPVTLMGATLPILVRFYVRNLDRLGRGAGRIYALNTAGAALGVVLTGFFLINSFGVWGTVLIVAGLNFLVGLTCLFFGSRLSVGTSSVAKSKTQTAEKSADDYGDKEKSHEAIAALILFAVSGFCAMAYQVIWIRLLGLLIAPTVYSFAIVVATFIVGLALGSLLFGWWGDRTAKVFPLLIGTQITAAGLALLVSQLLGQSQLFFAKLIYTFRNDFTQLTAVQFLVLFLLLLGPTLMLGATFPLVSKIYARSLNRIGRYIGSAYAVNTIGAILGSFSAGFLILPFLGKETGLTLVIAIQLAAAFLIWGYLARRRRSGLKSWTAWAALVLAGIMALTAYPSWDRRLLSYGRYLNFQAIEGDLITSSWPKALSRGPDILARYETGREVLFYGDGPAGFTTVEKLTDSLGQVKYTLLNSGKPDASSHGDASTQACLAHIPLLFHPRPRNVMVLGAGCGMTAGEVLLYPVDRVDVVEINEKVLQAGRFFEPWNNHYLDDPRTRVIIQDGRNHLALTNEKYDVIISEPSNPWMAGLANLYTLEFFLTVRERLEEGGLFIQWIHSYRMDWPTLALVGRTFARAFPEGLLMGSLVGAGDYFLVGFKNRPGLDPAVAQANLQFAEKSKVMKLSDPRLLYHLLVTEDLADMFGPGPLHTDDHPRLEYAAPRQLHRQDSSIEREMAQRGRLSPRSQAVLAETVDPGSLIDLAEFAASVYSPSFPPLDLAGADQQQQRRYYQVVEDYCARVLVQDYGVFFDERAKGLCVRKQIDRITKHLESWPKDAAAYHDLGLAYAQQGDLAAAVQSFETSIALDPHRSAAHNNLAVALARQGRLVEARRAGETALTLNPAYAKAYFTLANISLDQDRRNEAIQELRTGLDYEEDPAARRLLQYLEAKR